MKFMAYGYIFCGVNLFFPLKPLKIQSSDIPKIMKNLESIPFDCIAKKQCLICKNKLNF